MVLPGRHGSAAARLGRRFRSRTPSPTRGGSIFGPMAAAPRALGPASLVNMGNPHAVFFVPDLKRIDAAELGAGIEVHPMFPEKANVTFARGHRA